MYSIKKLNLQGSKNKYGYIIVNSNDENVFSSGVTEYCWCSKKHAQKVLDAVNEFGLEKIKEELKPKYSTLKGFK